MSVILNVLRAHGITQGVKAGLTSIPQSRLSEYNNGVREPTLDTLEKFAKGLDLPEPARIPFGLAPGSDAGASSGENMAAEPEGSADLLTLAWLAGSLNNHADRRAVLRLGTTLSAVPLLGVEESMDRLAYALLGPTTLQEDTVTFLEQRAVGLYRVEELFPARLVHRAIISHLREVTALLEGHAADPLWARLARVAGESSVPRGFYGMGSQRSDAQRAHAPAHRSCRAGSARPSGGRSCTRRLAGLVAGGRSSNSWRASRRR